MLFWRQTPRRCERRACFAEDASLRWSVEAIGGGKEGGKPPCETFVAGEDLRVSVVECQNFHDCQRICRTESDIGLRWRDSSTRTSCTTASGYARDDPNRAERDAHVGSLSNGYQRSTESVDQTVVREEVHLSRPRRPMPRGRREATRTPLRSRRSLRRSLAGRYPNGIGRTFPGESTTPARLTPATDYRLGS